MPAAGGAFGEMRIFLALEHPLAFPGLNRRQALSTYSAAIVQNAASALGGIAAEKAVLPFAADLRGLILSFHVGVRSKTGCPFNGQNRRPGKALRIFVHGRRESSSEQRSVKRPRGPGRNPRSAAN